ncbi:hypothetical protein WJX73_009125 [Symbiochloris irregularis]|uniref:Uncharacterized protein n=1 Tax=Symbiochloris irregularis TaxID=706552 RepID=A0AAW1NRC0_9CHLO
MHKSTRINAFSPVPCCTTRKRNGLTLRSREDRAESGPQKAALTLKDMAQPNRGAHQDLGSSDEVEVLCNLQTNTSRPQRSAEEDDLAMAKALQDQERALHRFGAHGDPFDENVDYSDAEGPGRGEDADLAFARRLQAEEMQQQYSRLFGLSGQQATQSQPGADGAVQEGGQGGWDQFDEDESDYDEDDDEMSPDDVDPDNMTYEELQALADTVGTVAKGLSPVAAHQQAMPQLRI